MGVHLQLYPPTFSGWTGCAVILLVLFAPGIIVAYIFQSLIWLVAIPAGIIAALVLVPLVGGVFNPNFGKRKVTAEQFANELERHLLGTEGKWDWDDITSVRIVDDRLERIRQGLPQFDSLKLEKDREDLKTLIAAIRRGEIPEVVPPEFITYR